MDKPKIAGTEPIQADLEEGKTYYWCTCGESSNKLFCDGSHQGTNFTPLEFTADKDEKAYLCACKMTKSPPYCDGTHQNL